jgi:cell division protein FtsL
MMTFIVIGACIILLLAVVYVSAKPISMGIEARRNLKDNEQNTEEKDENNSNFNNQPIIKNSIPDQIEKLNDLKNKGLLTEEEYKKAKEKILY